MVSKLRIIWKQTVVCAATRTADIAIIVQRGHTCLCASLQQLGLGCVLADNHVNVDADLGDSWGNCRLARINPYISV